MGPERGVEPSQVFKEGIHLEGSDYEEAWGKEDLGHL